MKQTNKLELIINNLYKSPNDSNLFGEEISKLLKSCTRISLKLFPKDFNFKKKYEVFQKAVCILSEKGWYVEYEMTFSDVTFAASLIENNKVEDADLFLKNYFDNEIDNIQKIITSRFPERAHVLNASFNAHRKLEFYLSTPVFFAQAEGICLDLTNYRFFSSQKGQPKTKKYFNSFKGTEILSDLLKPLIKIDVNRNFQIENQPDGQNRHDVLHGQSSDYGENSINSYKALSLLIYISDIVYSSIN